MDDRPHTNLPGVNLNSGQAGPQREGKAARSIHKLGYGSRVIVKDATPACYQSPTGQTLTGRKPAGTRAGPGIVDRSRSTCIRLRATSGSAVTGAASRALATHFLYCSCTQVQQAFPVIARVAAGALWAPVALGVGGWVGENRVAAGPDPGFLQYWRIAGSDPLWPIMFLLQILRDVQKLSSRQCPWQTAAVWQAMVRRRIALRRAPRPNARNRKLGNYPLP